MAKRGRLKLTITQRELARRLRLSVQQVANLVARGMPRESSGQYDPDKCWRWYVEFKTKRAGQREGVEDESRERARKLAADADLTELAVEERRGNLVTVEYMAKQLERICLRLRSRLLAVPGKAAPQVVGCRTVPEAQVRLEEIISECMAAMSETGEDPELDAPADYKPGAQAGDNTPAGSPKVAGKTRRPAARRSSAAT